MTQEKEQINFLEAVTNVEIAVSTKTLINLESIYLAYGKGFNTLIITNTDTTPIPIKIYLDGKEAMYLNGNNAVWSISAEDGLIYNQLEIENTSGAAVIAAGKLKISIGRMGVK